MQVDGNENLAIDSQKLSEKALKSSRTNARVETSGIKVLERSSSSKSALWFNVALDLKSHRNNIIKYPGLVQEACKRANIDRESVVLDWGDGITPDYTQLERFVPNERHGDRASDDDESAGSQSEKPKPIKKKKKKSLHPDDDYEMDEDFIDDSDVYIQFHLQDVDPRDNKEFLHSVGPVHETNSGDLIVGMEASEQSDADIFANEFGFFVWRGSLVKFDKIKEFLKTNDGEDSKAIPTFEVSYQPPALPLQAEAPEVLTTKNDATNAEPSKKSAVETMSMDVDKRDNEVFGTPKKLKKKKVGDLVGQKSKKALKSTVSNATELPNFTKLTTPEPEEFDMQVLQLNIKRVDRSKEELLELEKKKRVDLRPAVAARLAGLSEAALLFNWSSASESFPAELVPKLKAFLHEHFFNPKFSKGLARLEDGGRLGEHFLNNLITLLPFSVSDLNKICLSFIIPERIKRKNAELEQRYNALEKDICLNKIVPIEPLLDVPEKPPATSTVPSLDLSSDAKQLEGGAPSVENSSAVPEIAKADEKKATGPKRVNWNNDMRKQLNDIIKDEDKYAQLEHEYALLFGRSKRKSFNAIKSIAFTKLCDRFPTNWLKRSSISMHYNKYLRSVASAFESGAENAPSSGLSTPQKKKAADETIETPSATSIVQKTDVFSTPRKAKKKTSLESFFPNIDSPNGTAVVGSDDGSSPLSSMDESAIRITKESSTADVTVDKKKRKSKNSLEGEAKKKATASLVPEMAQNTTSPKTIKKNYIKPIAIQLANSKVNDTKSAPFNHPEVSPFINSPSPSAIVPAAPRKDEGASKTFTQEVHGMASTAATVASLLLSSNHPVDISLNTPKNDDTLRQPKETK